MTWTMLAEWLPHKRTWMAWPCSSAVIDSIGSAQKAHEAWSTVANTIAGFEPVTMVCNPEDEGTARCYLAPEVTLITHPIGDSWMRDAGATFVVNEAGALGGIDWTFNGWGGRTFPEGAADALLARRLISETGATRIPSKLVNEGGGIHVDGEGTVLLTETVQLNHNRNPSWTCAEVEAEIHARLGTRKAIWLPRGLLGDTMDNGTDGHVDTLANFVKPGVVVVHGQPDPNHPDHQTATEIEAILRRETDAKGRPLEVIVLNGPEGLFEDDGTPMPCSYVNFSFVNGGVVLCGFGTPQDAEVESVFRRLFNDRTVVMVPALNIFKGGGGVHCITQQEPLCQTNGA
ncbi:MAG: agmatine deiminase family protein [Proteobacteria bacterium]|nr:agmatine deiminase family protein [Pseudomonadota bacterium]MDA1285531.1 agmatine deiminase family protein [Pseudomonadota bacterium]